MPAVLRNRLNSSDPCCPITAMEQFPAASCRPGSVTAKYYRMHMSTVSTIKRDLQQDKVNQPSHHLNLGQKPPQQGEQQARPEMGTEELPGSRVFSEIHENSGAEDPAEGDAGKGIEAGIAH